ncbi:unnamed protein product [Acanthoscelides obtectus]|nr:unnamed protein product [Acanthoscelides obtectus]CAK1621007.1 CCAAT/enhancer-binding protein zeta [Acanthoscelides obtectus]
MDEDESDVESVQSEEFEEMLNQMSGVKEREDEIDYLDEIGDTLKYNKKDKGKQMDDESESDKDDNESEISDQELEEDFDDMEDASELDDFDEESDEDDEMVTKSPKSKRKGDTSSLFASAEEFATLLEDEGSSKVKPGGSNAFANMDNADTKQLAWEEQRNRWVKGYNRSFGKSSKTQFGKDKEVFKKRKNKSKFANKSKKIKK